VVLLKEVTEEGFVFYTNGESRKGRDLTVNPFGALCFLWPSEGAQVRVEGPVESLPSATSDAYFRSRPRKSQIGAWASLQSRDLGGRDELYARIEEFERRFQGADVPRPPHWGGYVLVPTAIEFWKEQPFRLHERHMYTRVDSRSPWVVRLLYP
jgi:pyridoxamine 5'-phosphate oxidase